MKITSEQPGPKESADARPVVLDGIPPLWEAI